MTFVGSLTSSWQSPNFRKMKKNMQFRGQSFARQLLPERSVHFHKQQVKSGAVHTSANSSFEKPRNKSDYKLWRKDFQSASFYITFTPKEWIMVSSFFSAFPNVIEVKKQFLDFGRRFCAILESSYLIIHCINAIEKQKPCTKIQVEKLLGMLT